MALTDNLISYWKLDEASGNALDAHGSNNLTEFGTGGIGSTTGKINNARDFEAGDSDYFSLADNTDLSTGDIDFSFSLWLKWESLATNQGIVGKWDGLLGGVAPYEHILFFDVATTKIGFYKTSNGSLSTLVGAIWGTTVSTGAWYHVVCWHDASANQIGIAVNDGTPVTTSTSSGVYDGSSPFRIGWVDSAATTEKYDGLIDEVGFWKRVLTSGERTSLYNGGNGLAYPFGGPFPFHLDSGAMAGGLQSLGL